jgi:soluble lytic murein transglycosylase
VHKQIADELFFLGLYDEAAPELEASYPVSTPSSARPSDVDYTLAVAYTRGDLANRGVGFMELLWRNVPADYQIELIPREDLDLLFPAPYKDSLLRYAPPRSVDPRFILAIMRQESRFRADIKSYAAARGLMQFISTTSDRVAAQLGRKDFQQDELYSPSISILFGSQYLSGLFKEFPGQPEAVAASYNGGDDNTLRWLTRSKSNSPEQYVSEIGFAQSKDYVYKVMSNYRIYKFLYTPNLEPAQHP